MGYPRGRNTAATARLAMFLSLVIPLLGFPLRSASAAYAVLAWTSPSDNGAAGRAVRYDLRISTKAVSGNDTLSWWNSATIIRMSGKSPGPAGSPDSILLGGLLIGVRYYAVLRSADATPNWSDYSNVAMFAPNLLTAVPEGDPAPALVLGAPRPTPTIGPTQVSLELPRSERVEASVFNAQGRLVRNLEGGTLPAGSHMLRWDGRLEGGGGAPSGVYWIRVATGRTERRVKVIIVR